MEKDLLNTIQEVDISKVSNEKIIEVKKLYSAFNFQARKNAKQTSCILCGKECTSFCNSHTIPRFILKNISESGYLALSYSGLQMPLMEKITGINKTLTFSCICKNCDDSKFKEYEMPDNYLQATTKVMLSQIALKNILRMYSKRLIEIEQHKEMCRFDINSSQQIKIDQLDLKDYKNEIINIKNDKVDYYLIDEINLNYRTSIAFQGICNLVSGFNGELINDIYNSNPNYKLQGLHIAVFPLTDERTKILLFIKNGSKRLRPFYKNYRKLDLKEKLYVINYIVLSYSEDWVSSPSSSKILASDDNVKETIKTGAFLTVQFGYGSNAELKEKALKTAKSKLTLQTFGELYNFLENHENKSINKI